MVYGMTEKIVKNAMLMLCLPVILAACSGAYESIDDRELRQRHYQCQHATSLSVAEIQICQNVLRECQRRARKGDYVC